MVVGEFEDALDGPVRPAGFPFESHRSARADVEVFVCRDFDEFVGKGGMMVRRLVWHWWRDLVRTDVISAYRVIIGGFGDPDTVLAAGTAKQLTNAYVEKVCQRFETGPF